MSIINKNKSLIDSIRSPILRSFLIKESKLYDNSDSLLHLLPNNTSVDEVKNNSDVLRNSPFQFRKSNKTGKWNKPRYSLRQQADLLKAARSEGLLHLLPTSIKNKPSDYLQVDKSIGKPFNWQEKSSYDVLKSRPKAVSQSKFRGTLWQRKLPSRSQTIQENLQNMDQKIIQWKKVSYHILLRLYFFTNIYLIYRKKQLRSKSLHHLYHFSLFDYIYFFFVL